MSTRILQGTSVGTSTWGRINYWCSFLNESVANKYRGNRKGNRQMIFFIILKMKNTVLHGVPYDGGESLIIQQQYTYYANFFKTKLNLHPDISRNIGNMEVVLRRYMQFKN